MGTAPAVRPSSPCRRPPPRAELRALLQRATQAGATGTDVAVLSALWTHADRHGGCWPSQPRLARLARRCERTVRTSVQRMESLGVIVRSVPSHGARRWGWTDPTTGARVSRRSTVYVIAADEAREPRPVAAAGVPAEPSPEITEAAARVAAAVARTRSLDDETPSLSWGEPVEIMVPIEPPPAWATTTRSTASSSIIRPRFHRVAAAVFARAIDRQRLPPKCSNRNPVSETEPSQRAGAHTSPPRVAALARPATTGITSPPPREGPFRAPERSPAVVPLPAPVPGAVAPPARTTPEALPPPLAERARALLLAARRRR